MARSVWVAAQTCSRSIRREPTVGFRFRRRVNLGGGLGLNLGRKGASVSLRTKAGTIGRRGVSVRTGIPGMSFFAPWGSGGRRTKADGPSALAWLLLAPIVVSVAVVVVAAKVLWWLVQEALPPQASAQEPTHGTDIEETPSSPHGSDGPDAFTSIAPPTSSARRVLARFALVVIAAAITYVALSEETAPHGAAAAGPALVARRTAPPTPKTLSPPEAALEAMNAGNYGECIAQLNRIGSSVSEIEAHDALRERCIAAALLAFNDGTVPRFRKLTCKQVAAFRSKPGADTERVVGTWVDWPIDGNTPQRGKWVTHADIDCTPTTGQPEWMNAAFPHEQMSDLEDHRRSPGRVRGRIAKGVLGNLVLNPVVVRFADGMVVAAPPLRGF